MTREFKIGPINSINIRECLQVQPNGFVKVKQDPIDMQKVREKFEYALSERGGNQYKRVSAIRERIAKNSRRAHGTSPVRGSGVRHFGVSVGLGEPEEELTEKEKAKILQRAKAIDTSQRDTREAMLSYMEDVAKDDPQLVGLMECEAHQLLTGGGYDNGEPVDQYTTIMNFAKRVYELPELSDDDQQLFVEICDRYLQYLYTCGFREHSLKPAAYVDVREEQALRSNDGTIGFGVLQPGKQPFTQDIADFIHSQWQDVDLSDRVGMKVMDANGQEVDYRNIDAVTELIELHGFDPMDCEYLTILFQRVQRTGYKDEDGEMVVKGPKYRGIYDPSALEGAINGCIFQPLQEEAERLAKAGSFPDMPSLMDQAGAKGTLTRDAIEADDAGYVILSADESGYDQCFSPSLTATVMERVIKPLFEEQYHDVVDAATCSLVYKTLIVPKLEFDQALAKAEDTSFMEKAIVAFPNKPVEKQYYLIFCCGGLGSGLKGTHLFGSWYGRVVCHGFALSKLRCPIPEGKVYWPGHMAGDDSEFWWPKTMYHPGEGADINYQDYSKILEVVGMVINTAKQILVEIDQRPVGIFLQKVYHPDFDSQINGCGSACRVVQQVEFSEYSPTQLNTAEQAIAQISVMENGWDNPFIKEALRLWLQHDPKLLNLFQTFGPAAWGLLTKQAHFDNPEIVKKMLNLETKGANGWQRTAEEVIQDISLHIIDKISEVASSMEPSHESWATPDDSSKDQEQLSREAGTEDGLGIDDPGFQMDETASEV